jgi:hypothetical protein
MVTALTARAGSWNIVSSSGGADDADFKQVFEDYYTATSGQGTPWTETARASCPDTDALDTRINNIGNAVNIAFVGLFSAASTADANVRKIAITYPHVLASTSACEYFSSGTAPHKGAVDAVDDLDQYITGLSTDGVTVVDLRTAIGFGINPMGSLQDKRYFGYPHPNSAGQAAISSAVVAAIPHP